MKKILILAIMALIALMPLSGAIDIKMFTLSETVNTPKINNYNGYINITVHETWEMLTSTSDGIQKPIDIRTLGEWKQGRIDTPPPEDPVRWTNLHYGDGLQEFMDEYADKQVVIYCRSANRSWTATKLLINNGFTGTIYHMVGGINAWKDAGYPTIGNQPPTTPHIDGPTSGKTGIEHSYGICSEDPDEDDITYCIDWDDDTGEECIGPISHGKCILQAHTWFKQGIFTIRVKASDGQAESDWGELEVTMPRSKVINTSIQWLFQSRYNLLPILQILLKQLGLG